LIWQKGLLIDATKLTVAQHLHNWLDGKSDLCPLSRQGYVHIIERQIIPTLGAIELQKLKVADVKAWLTAVRSGARGGERSARTIRHAYRVLHAALKAAVREELLARNVVDNVEPPSRRSRRWRY
jgi:hypothetical protein